MSQIALLLETSSKQGKVGLAREGQLTGQAALDPRRRHARDLSSTVQRLLSEASLSVCDLTTVMVSTGPGSYTGLRVGVISAKALAYARGLELVAVPTFAIVAEQAPVDAQQLMVVGDALKGMIYRQRFERGPQGWQPRDELQIAPAQTWLPWIAGETWLSGPGVDAYPTLIPCQARIVPDADREPRLEAMLAVGRRLPALSRDEQLVLEPIYLRGSSAEEKLKNLAEKQ